MEWLCNTNDSFSAQTKFDYNSNVSYRAIWAGIGDTFSTGYMNQFWGEFFFVEDLLGRGTRTLEYQLSFFHTNTFIAWMFQVSLDPW